MSTSQTPSGGSGSAPARPMLAKWERIAAAAAAALFSAVLIVLLINPPDRVDKLDGCKSEDPTKCIVTVDGDVGALAPALVAGAGVLALLAILGQRFTSIKVPGIGELGVASATEVKKDTPQKEASKGQVEAVAGAGESDLVEQDLWSALPPWTQAALYRWAADNPVLAVSVSDAIIEAFKPSGQGNHPWYIRLDDSAGEERTLRIATGRGSAQVQDA